MDCLAYASRRTARAVTNYMNGLLKPLDLSTAQFGLLMVIAKQPDRSLREISHALVLDESTMARNLAVLERRGLTVAEGGRGRSGKRVALTEAGWDLLAAGAGIWRDANRALAKALPPEDMAAGRRYMDALARASEQLAAERHADEPVLLGEGVD